MLGQPTTTSRQGRGDAGSFLSERNNNSQMGKPATVSGSVPPVGKMLSVDDQNCSSPNVSAKENSFFKGKAKKTAEQKKRQSSSGGVAKIKSRKRAARPAFPDSSSDESHLPPPQRPVKPTKRSKTEKRPFV